MADKTPNGGHDPAHRPNWTDSFPHGFQGWGPQTPDWEGEHIKLRVHHELTWHGRSPSGREHIVWRFDRKPH